MPGVVGATVVVGAAVVAGAAVVVTSQVLAQAPLQHERPSSQRPTFHFFFGFQEHFRVILHITFKL